METAKVIRLTADGAVTSGVKVVVSAVQLIGGTAVTSLYNDTSAVAANLALQLTSPTIQTLDTPLEFDDLYVDAGAGITDILIHVV